MCIHTWCTVTTFGSRKPFGTTVSRCYFLKWWHEWLRASNPLASTCPWTIISAISCRGFSVTMEGRRGGVKMAARKRELRRATRAASSRHIPLSHESSSIMAADGSGGDTSALCAEARLKVTTLEREPGRTSGTLALPHAKPNPYYLALLCRLAGRCCLLDLDVEWQAPRPDVKASHGNVRTLFSRFYSALLFCFTASHHQSLVRLKRALHRKGGRRRRLRRGH